jgi:hypothetical protein
MYESKINSARQLIDTHNSNVDPMKQINFDDVFLVKLQEMGGTTEETLSQCSWEDLENCGIPRLIARQISQIFRAKDSKETKSSYVSERKASTMTIRELLEAYNPYDIKNVIAKRLLDISESKRCIVFKPDGNIDIDNSEKILLEISKGYDEIETIIINGIPTVVHFIGENIDLYADENPIYIGRALRSDGTCDQTGRSWEGVSLIVKQLLWIAITEGELVISSLDDAHNVLDKALMNNALIVLRQRYPKSSLLLDEVQKVGNLPTLKIKLSKSKNSKIIESKTARFKDNDPFYRSKKF